MVEQYSISGSKNVQNKSFRPGEILFCYITATNTGTDSLYNVTFTDDLGGVGGLLTYVDGSISICKLKWCYFADNSSFS